MILVLCLRCFSPEEEEEEHGYAVVNRRRTAEGGLIYYDPGWPSLYRVPTMQDAIKRHAAKRRPGGSQWENGDMFLVFKMGQKVIRVVAMFERMDGSLTPRTISDYPDDVKEIIARLREET